MDVAHPTHHHVQRVSFHLLTPDQIRRVSVRSITNVEIFDQLNHPARGGLYDPALGPIDKNGRCGTCGLGFFQCPGHFGHVELAVPVYAPLTFGQMFQVLRQCCLYCHRFRGGSIKLLDAGLLIEAKELDHYIYQRDFLEEHGKPDVDTVVNKMRLHVQTLLAGRKETAKRKQGAISDYRSRVIGDFLKFTSASNVCQHCRGYIPTFYRHAGTKIFINPLRKNQRIMMDAKGMDAERVFKRAMDRANGEREELEDTEMSNEIANGMKFLTPMHVYEHLRRLWKNESHLCQLMFGSQLSRREKVDHRIFFAEIIAVPPCRFRPPSVFGGDQFDHPQNTYLVDIIKLNSRIIELRSSMKGTGKKELDKLENEGSTSFAELILTWVSLQEQVNYFFDSSRNTKAIGNVPPPGIKQILEKKEGLFRKHMMGKRVNYAARSVISPDPNLETSEIGVPMVFATRLTYPEPVTEHNVTELRAAVINGPDVHPGAAFVQMEDGTLANLESMSKSARVALANQLRTPSTGITDAGSGLTSKKVMRHIRNGDVVLMNRQPTLHKPSIMAHRVRVLPGEKTIRMHYANCNTYNADFDGDEMNMHFPQNELARAEAYCIANTNNQYLVPTDGSPLRGLIQDHIVSGVLLSLKDTWLTRETYHQLLWGSLPETNNRVLTIPPAIIRPRLLWSGKQVITSVLLNLTNGHSALNLTSNCKIGAKLWGRSHADEAQVVLQEGYLCTGVMDKSQFGASAYGITHAVYELYGANAAGSLLTTIGRLLTKYDQLAGFTCRMDDLLLDSDANRRRRELISASHPIGRQVLADYSKVADHNDIEAIQESLEKIVRSDELSRGLDGMMKVKMNDITSKIIETCLPDGQLRPFPFNNMSLMTTSGAKGSMVNFSQITGLLGQQELEGRRVPVMVSGKTLPSFPAFDPRARASGYITQRFLTGIRPQEFFFHCMAGREGLIDTAVKTSRSGYLQRCLIKHMENLKVHYDHTVRDCDGSILQFHYGEDGLDVVKQKYLRNHSFAANNLDLITEQCQPQVMLERVNTISAVKAAKKVMKKPKKYEPVLTRYPPTVYLGSVSERYYTDLEKYIDGHSDVVSKLDLTHFRAIMWLRYMRSLVEPGEAVGLLAAQSVGEPSTQMTLNTFHFAGFGAKNVTLGIPRLREIIMTASQKIKTPSITVPLKKDVAQLPPEEIAKLMSKVTLKQLIREIGVEEKLMSSVSISAAVNLGRRARVYSITLQFVPIGECQEQFRVRAEEIQDSVENGFVKVLLSAIDKTLKRATKGGNLISREALRETPMNINASGEGQDDQRQVKTEREFDDDEEEEGSADEDVLAKESLRRQAGQQEADATSSSDSEDDEVMEIDPEEGSTKSSAIITSAKKESVLSQTRSIIGYLYDQRTNTVTMDMVYPASQTKLLLLDILERHVGDVVIRQVPGINRVFPLREDPNAPGITTEGANLRGLWEHPLSSQLDLKHLYSNDIHAILSRYGVEAARATIVKEIAGVFAVYGISIDIRHLYLIADYMTVDGGYKPFNRMGIASSSSPLLQMTFETTMGFLRNAAMIGDFDDLSSPSSRIVMGLPVTLGTGSFEIRQSLA